MKRESPKRIAKKVLLGTVLGDAHLSLTSINKALLKLAQGVDQLDYLIWKMQMLKPLVGTFGINKFGAKDRWGGKPRLQVWSLSSTYLKHIYDDFYFEHNSKIKKEVKLNVLRRLTPISIAVWYMDDGCLVHRGEKIYGVRLYTNGFSKNEQDTMVFYFKEAWNIDFQVLEDKRSKSYFLNARADEGKKFIELIKPFICESMTYKIDPLHKSAKHYEIGDEEIVRSLQECKELIRNNQPSVNKEIVVLSEIEKKALQDYVGNSNWRFLEVCSWRRPGNFKRFELNDIALDKLQRLRELFGGYIGKKSERALKYNFVLTETKALTMFKCLDLQM